MGKASSILWRGVILITAGLTTVHLAARHIDVQRLSIESGLSHPTIYAVIQDARGLLWFGSPNGVNIYDGYGFLPFQQDVLAEMDEAELNTSELFIDREGRIWIGTWGAGLLCYEPESGRLRTFLHDPADASSLSHNRIQTIFQDSQGRIWIGTNGGGLNLYLPETASFQHWSERNSGLLNSRIWCILEGIDGNLWLGTSLGLHRFVVEEETFESYRAGLGGHGLSHDEVRCMARGADDRLWVGTRKGLNRFDPMSGQFEGFFFDANAPEFLVSDFINELFLDEQQRLWIGTIAGVTVWRDEPKKATPTALFHTLEDVDVRAICVDQSGVVWVGSRNTGVYKLQFLPFDHHNRMRGTALPDDYVTAFAMGSDPDHLWVGTTGGLARWHRVTGKVRTYEHNPARPQSLGHSDVFALFIDRADTLWVGLASYGLDRFNPSDGTFAHFRHDPNADSSLSSDQVRVIFEDSQQRLWIGTNRGLNHMQRQNNTFEVYRHDPKQANSLSDDSVRAIYEDRSKRLWVGTVNGLNRMQTGMLGFRRYQRQEGNANSLSNNRIRTIYESGQQPGVLWIGTGRGGLNRFDVVTETFTRYRERDGLPHNTVYGIVGDERGHLWLSTFGGLCRFDPLTERFERFDVSDGLQDIQFNRGAYFRAPDGQMFFGGLDGFNAFYPQEIQPNPYPPPVIVTAMTRDNQTFYLPDFPNDTLVVDHGSRDLGLEFAALSFQNPADNRYAYRFSESDPWIQLGHRRYLTLAELSPGQYNLQVRAANNDGVWNDSPYALRLHVAPPPWRTPMALLLYVLLALALGLLIHFWRLKRLERRRHLLETIVTERTRELTEKNAAILQRQNQLVTQEKMASLGMLTAGVAHEIRNPLNFVNNFALSSAELCRELRDELHDGDQAAMVGQLLADLEKNVVLIEKHGAKANAIVQSMTELARGDASEPERIDLNSLVEKYADVTFAGERARFGSVNIQFVKELADDLPNLAAVPQSLSRVLINLLKNAMDALRERVAAELAADNDGYRPRLVLQTRRVDRGVELSIWDNGTGIPHENLDKIFNPFFTTKPTGTGNLGLGLSISYEIVANQHGGELRVETEPGRYTRTIIWLPEPNGTEA